MAGEFNLSASAVRFGDIVIASVRATLPIGRRVVRESAPYPMNDMPVFGPASRVGCGAWRGGNCLAL